LRACDWATNIERLHQSLSLLTPPIQPAAPTIPQPVQENFRLHVEPGGNFRTLQEAAMRVTAEYETNRQRARREMLVELNQPNARRDQETRRIANEHAQQIRPRGKGSAFIVKSGE
jgi:hypothetical protein